MSECDQEAMFNSSNTEGLSGRFVSRLVKDVLMQKQQLTLRIRVNEMLKLHTGTYKHINQTF